MRAGLLAFALGVWCLQQQATLPGWGVVVFSCALIFGAMRWRTVALCVLAAMSLGFSYAALRAEWRLAEQLPASYEQRDITLTGIVRGLPEPGDEGTRFLFDVQTNDLGIDHFPRIVRLTWMSDASQTAPMLEAGQRWTLKARLKRPHSEANFGLRDMEASMLERGIRATGYVSDARSAHRLSDAHGPLIALDRMRSRIRARIESVLGDAPHRGIVIALAVGAQNAVSDADWTLMRATGTSHLVAISGLHIGFVAGLAAFVCGFVWKRLSVRAPLLVSAPKIAAASAAIFAAFYAALAGLNVPAQRALWMLCFIAVAYLRGRRPASSLVLCWALAAVLIADPWAVTSPGFWLSFCAVAAILHAMTSAGRQAKRARVEGDLQIDWNDRDIAIQAALTDDFAASVDEAERAFHRSRFASIRIVPARVTSVIAARLMHRLRSAARVQYAVTLALAPLTVYWFSQIPLLGPLANAFAIPWVSLVVTPAVLAGVILPAPLDAVAFQTAHAALSLLCDALAMLGRYTNGVSVWHLPRPDAFALAASVAGVAWALAPRGWPLRFAVPLTFLPLLAPTPNATPTGEFRVTALDVGQGSSLVIETAHHALLFDAGPGPESTHAGERIVAPYLLAAGVHTLDAFIVSHADSDHAGGAPAVLQTVAVRQLLASLPDDHPLWSDARARGTQTLRCIAGQTWHWDGVEFRMLWPIEDALGGKPNRTSCVLKATNASGRSALLAADIEADVERELIARDSALLHADVLIVPHHGSRTSSTEPFLDAVGPRAAIFQVGYRNRFHHPNPTVYARYGMRSIALARSDENGAARIDIGTEIVLERFRDAHARYWMDR